MEWQSLHIEEFGLDEWVDKTQDFDMSNVLLLSWEQRGVSPVSMAVITEWLMPQFCETPWKKSWL